MKRNSSRKIHNESGRHGTQTWAWAFLRRKKKLELFQTHFCMPNVEHSLTKKINRTPCASAYIHLLGIKNEHLFAVSTL